MKILLSPGIYLPHQRAGSEIYLHRVVSYLMSKGHEVKRSRDVLRITVLRAYKFIKPSQITRIVIMTCGSGQIWFSVNYQARTML
jgi:hypothetical protein